jgi:ComF family protein
MKKIMHRATHTIFSVFRYLIAPPFCTYCKQFLSEYKPLCAECTALIRPVVSATLSVTKKYSVTVFAIANYTYPLKALILAKRWSNIVASTQLGELMWEMTYIRNVPFDYIVPIPLHWTRFSWRGYNQAEEIAQVLSTHSGKPVIQLLQRAKRTQFQSSIPVEQRASNLRDAFYIDEKYRSMIQGKHILLVDDLLTTSATLTSAAHELIQYKPAQITGIVACRVV